eukprot:1073592-Pleurochrysis_carterae.AAC.1
MRNEAEALVCVESRLFKAKVKAVAIHVMYHSIPQSNACEESPLKVREKCVSRIAEKRFGLRASSFQKVKWAATARESQ